MLEHTTTSPLDSENLIFDEALHRPQVLGAQPPGDYRYSDHDGVTHQVLVVPMLGERLRIIDETPTEMRLVEVLKPKAGFDGDASSALTWARDYAAQWRAYYDGARAWPPMSVTGQVTRLFEPTSLHDATGSARVRARLAA